jgi:ribose-phosphate pyrophosphokinase
MRASQFSLFAFPDCLRFARQIARATHARVANVRVHTFPDRETLIRVDAPAPSRAVVVSSLEDPNSKIFQVALAADALRHAGAASVELVAPYMPYMRQDTVFEPGEPVSQRVIADILGRSFDAVFTMEPHLHRIRALSDVFPTRAIAVSAAPAIAAWVKRRGAGTLVAGPDEESARWVRAIARDASAMCVVGDKRRLGDRDVRINFGKLPAARRAIVVDDIASSGATMAAAIRALRTRGIERVEAVVVHAIFAPGALAIIRRAGATRVVSCDTVAHPTNAIRVAGLFAAALKPIR